MKIGFKLFPLLRKGRNFGIVYKSENGGVHFLEKNLSLVLRDSDDQKCPVIVKGDVQ